MNLNFLKLKRNKLPPLKSLRPVIFDTDSYWFASLGVYLLIFVITGLIGLWLFYSQYSESYRDSRPKESFENPINIDLLKNVVQKREDFKNREVVLPRDPSL